MNGRRTIVRLASASIAVLVILVYGIGRGRVEYGEDTVYGRKLLSIEEDDVCKTEGHGNDQDNANCTTPLNHGNDSCQFVYDNCGDDVQLFDYLAFVACDLPYLQVFLYISSYLLNNYFAVARLYYISPVVAVSHISISYYCQSLPNCVITLLFLILGRLFFCSSIGFISYQIKTLSINCWYYITCYWQW